MKAHHRYRHKRATPVIRYPQAVWHPLPRCPGCRYATYLRGPYGETLVLVGYRYVRCIYEGETPLDSTAIHPESYELARSILAEIGIHEDDLRDRANLPALALKTAQTQPASLAKKLGAGIPTVTDILKAIARPGRDPREDLPAPLTRQNIVKLSDLAVGTILKGTVRNITDFGAFIDIGLKQAGLLHISEMSHRRVRHPLDVLSVGDSLDVMIISIDEARGRIGLSLKRIEKEKARA